MRWVKVSIYFTVTIYRRSTDPHNPLNLRNDCKQERLLHATCKGKGYIAQTRIGDSMKSILDPSFRYTKSVDTDLRKTFARIRREQQRQVRMHAADAGTGVVLALGQRKVRAAA